MSHLGGSPTTETKNVDPLGPVFVSYRASDGTDAASTVAWALRATGVPVWHDSSDLLPGDTSLRLTEALDSGMSGAVLVVTPEIQDSSVVHDLELPALLDLEAHSEFSLAVANAIEDPAHPGSLDYDAPDLLLRQPDGRLKRLKQYRLIDPVDVARLAHALAMRRMQAHAAGDLGPVVLDIQSRTDPIHDGPRVALVVRTEPPDPGRRTPPQRIWHPYAAFLTSLPRLVATARSSEVEVRGGAHLSIALALGAALPVTTTTTMTIVDQSGTWTSELSEEAPPLEVDFVSSDAGRRLAVYVELVDTPAPVDSFSAHVDQRPERYSGVARIHPNLAIRLQPSSGGATAATVARHIRECASRVGTNQVDLFLRVPFPIAVLLGRLLNTLAVDPYEWEGGDTPPRYVRTVTVASGVGGGPIVLDENGT
jgi:hypothetical protein